MGAQNMLVWSCCRRFILKRCLVSIWFVSKRSRLNNGKILTVMFENEPEPGNKKKCDANKAMKIIIFTEEGKKTCFL